MKKKKSPDQNIDPVHIESIEETRVKIMADVPKDLRNLPDECYTFDMTAEGLFKARLRSNYQQILKSYSKKQEI